MTRPWMGVLPPPRGQGYYADEGGLPQFFAPMPPTTSSTPRVTRSRFVEDDKAVIMDGNQFEDGKMRAVLPESASQTYFDDVTALLEGDDRRAERMRALLATFQPKAEAAK